MTLALIITGLAYLVLLFLVAHWFERKAPSGKLRKHWPYVYALSLAVYCTAWTFYGSVGRVSTHGFDFLLIYLGPTLVMFIWWPLAGRLIELKKAQGIGSLADLLSSRYGKSPGIGRFVAVLCLLGVLPYISLQIKAVTESYAYLADLEIVNSGGMPAIWTDPGLYITAIMCLFTIIYGTRYVRSSGPKPGLLGTIAVEGVVKLFAFLVAGGIAVYYLSGSGIDFTVSVDELVANHTGYEEWTALLAVSALAMLMLPRQFQIGVVEVNETRNIRKALWLFPLYLLLINLFVVPIALAGQMISPDSPADYHILSVSSILGGDVAALFVFVGGLSAASSMIIVSTLALGNMLSTHIILPQMAWRDRSDAAVKVLQSRRWAIGAILLLAYLYYRLLAAGYDLVSIGIISFIAVAQFAPAFIGGLFWSRANARGAYAGIAAGFGVWIYFFILPEFYRIAGIDLPQFDALHLASTLGMSPVSAGVFLSLSANAVLFALVSLNASTGALELAQAKVYRMAMRGSFDASERMYSGTAHYPDIKSLLIKFLGNKATEEVLNRYARLNGIDLDANPRVDGRLVSFAERLLSEAVGPASARIAIASVVSEEEVGIDRIVDILEESQRVLELNRALQQKTEELRRAGDELKAANQRLKEFGELKDEFLYTVAHELRTPLTAIRMQAEIIHDDDTMNEEDRERFLSNIISDCERLTRLISNVLDLEKYESGSQRLQLRRGDIRTVITEVAERIRTLALERGVRLDVDLPADLPLTYMDADRISQVVHNLLANALKFSNPADGRTRVEVVQRSHAIEVAVCDNGAGISEDDRERVFEKFYQARNQTRRKPSGSGLGLAICKNIIQLHRGEIWIDPSAETGGTKVIFTLPIYRSENPYAHQAQDTHRG